MSQVNFQTSDLSLCGTLQVLGFEIKSINKVNGKAIFVFHNSGRLEKIIQQYFNSKLLIEPKAFFNCLKTLKTRIYNENA